MTATWSLIVILVGFLAGGISGLVGIGGGVIIVPALIYLIGASQQMAQGTTLAMLLLPIGFLAVMTYAKAGYVNWPVALLLGVGYIGGSWLGARFALSVSTGDLKRVFALLLLVMACKMLWESFR
jgi:uncharacterized protein